MDSSDKKPYFLDEITLNTLKALFELLENSSLSSMRYEQEKDGVRHFIELLREPQQYSSFKSASSETRLDTESFKERTSSPPESPKVQDNLYWVRSPLVGTAYVSSSPGSVALVKVGDHIVTGAPLLVIEAMKVMNIIKSPVSGCVREVCFLDGYPVEYDERLLGIDTKA